MANTRKCRAFVMTLSIVLSGSPGAIAAATRPTVVLRIDDSAHVPPRDLAKAKVEIERVYRAAGVDVSWTGNVAGESRFLTVMLVNNRENPARGGISCVLGVALPALGRAYVFVDRIIDALRSRPADADVVLARVIAHEVGHLLLPPGSHSRYGIMRADLDVGYANPNRFTDDQATFLRSALSTTPSSRSR
jgi:hypothetical protein